MITTSPVSTPENPVSKPLVHPPVATSPKQEEVIYLAIPQSHLNRSEVKTLLAEAAGTPDKSFEDKSVKEETSPVKSEQAEIQECEEVVQESSSVILDQSIIPEGQGMIDG